MSSVINGYRTDSCVFILELSHGALVDLVALVIGAQNPQGLLPDDWQKHAFNLLPSSMFNTQECPEWE